MQMIKILLVDDEPSVIKGLNLLVDWAEYNCSIIGSAGNGEIALRKIKELEPDLIIIDINMPIMTGLELLKALKDEEINIKTIILSGHDDFEYLKQGLLFNVENYLLKPVDKEELIKTITLI